MAYKISSEIQYDASRLYSPCNSRENSGSSKKQLDYVVKSFFQSQEFQTFLSLNSCQGEFQINARIIKDHIFIKIANGSETEFTLTSNKVQRTANRILDEAKKIWTKDEPCLAIVPYKAHNLERVIGNHRTPNTEQGQLPEEKASTKLSLGELAKLACKEVNELKEYSKRILKRHNKTLEVVSLQEQPIVNLLPVSDLPQKRGNSTNFGSPAPLAVLTGIQRSISSKIPRLGVFGPLIPFEILERIINPRKREVILSEDERSLIKALGGTGIPTSNHRQQFNYPMVLSAQRHSDRTQDQRNQLQDRSNINPNNNVTWEVHHEVSPEIAARINKLYEACKRSGATGPYIRPIVPSGPKIINRIQDQRS